jgi:NTP pyrophosphatase (non-canonical NTP hydrolase)
VSLGLAGEAGETAEQVKKTWRDDRGIRCRYCKNTELRDICPESDRGVFSCSPERYITVTDERREKIVKELGDVLWYAAQLSTELGMDLGEVAQRNIEKLSARRVANLIHGEGSDR